MHYLKDLGVTTVELLPVHQFVPEPFLAEHGLTNYWGYNSIGFFAPHNGYATGGDRGQQVGEFKAMVKALHAAGLEVVLDVVYNHTAEASPLGPTLSFRGLDDIGYYKHVDWVNDGSTYFDVPGAATPRRGVPQDAAADPGLAALLGHRDARRRLPLRPRSRPDPERASGRPPRAFISAVNQDPVLAT